MIDFRYHIVSIIAVFLALALGLFLGSTTLQSTVTDNLHKQEKHVVSENHTLTTENHQLNGQLGDQQDFITAVAPYAIEDRLTGRSIAIVSAPGVDNSTRQAVESDLRLAGATVSADVELQAAYVDPTQDTELGALAPEIVLPHHPLPAGSGSTQVSSVLAAALTSRPVAKTVPRRRIADALNALADGKFLTIVGSTPSHQANLAVMLVPPPSTSITSTQAAAQNSILLTLAADLGHTSAVAVLAGSLPDPHSTDGTLGAARASSAVTQSVSTVDLGPDGSDQTAGRIGIVLALAALPGANPGEFGLGSPAGTPLPATTATP
jgi:hypothetical protein